MKLNINRFGATLNITASEVDISTANNTSYINVSVSITTTGDTYNNTNSAYITGTLTGKNNTINVPKQYFKIGKGTTKTVYTAKLGPFTHDSDGSLPNVTISFNSYVTSSNKPSKTISCKMSTIPRATIIPDKTVTIGSQDSIAIQSASTSFTHTLSWKIGAQTGTIATKSSNTTFYFTIPTSIYSLFPNSSSISGELTLVTYSGNTTIGTTKSTLTVLANEANCKPTFATYMMVDTNQKTISTTGSSNVIVLNASNVRGTIACSTKNYATPKTLSVAGKSITFTSTQSGANYNISATFTIDNAPYDNYDVTITDSRGYSTTISPTNVTNILPYNTPSISATWRRTSPTGNTIDLVSLSGFISTVSFGQLPNVLHVEYRYKNGTSPFTNESWVNITNNMHIDYSASKFELYSPVQIQNVDYMQAGSIELKVSDTVSEIVQKFTLPKGTPIYHVGEHKLEVDEELHYKNKELVDLIYPIGSIFISTINTNPQTYLGGTWVAFGTGKTLVGVDASDNDFKTVEKTGGNKAMQSHTHNAGTLKVDADFYLRHGATEGTAIAAAGTNTTVTTGAYSSTWGNGFDTSSYSHKPDKVAISATPSGATASSGSGNSGNLQPYITVYMFKRTA